MADSVNVKWTKYPYTGKEASLRFHKLEDEVIDKVVPAGIMPGNYRIGRLQDGKFKMLYIGRVDDRQDDGLKDRLKEHIGEWPGELYFDYQRADDVDAAYYKECEDYHVWKGDKGKLENDKHPRKPDGRDDLECPFCG